MSEQEFETSHFHAGMKAIYKGETFDIASVDFEENLIGIMQPHSEDIQWKRCENIEVV